MSEDGRIPLYKIPEYLRSLDLFLLLGQPLHADDFTDDQYGRLLERLGGIGSQKLLAGILDQVFFIFSMPESRDYHSDTTSHVMYGKYSDCTVEGFEGLVITWGHSKDNQPKKKQTKTGAIVDGNGVLRQVSSLDGNESDSTWNIIALKDLHKELGDRIDQFIYIADSKMVSLPVLKVIHNGKKVIKFISLIPANFFKKLSERARKRAYDSDSWQYCGQCCIETKAHDRATYSVCKDSEEIEGFTYRLLVIKSSSHRKDAEEKIETEKNDIIKMAEGAFPEFFQCEPDAKEAIKKFQESSKTGFYTLKFEIVSIIQEKKRRGPKPKNPRPEEYITVYQVKIKTIIPNDGKIEAFKRKEESFVLITSVSEDELSDRDVLKKYKSQGNVERTFSRLKRPLMVNTLFVKTPQRIEAIMALVYIALLFQSIMQSMARYRSRLIFELPKIKYAKRKLENPTYDLIEHLLRPFEVISSGVSMEVSCLVPELEQYLDLMLFLIDAEEC
jgi:transposase